MSEEDAVEFAEIGGKQVSLADLAGLDLSETSEKRGSTIPAGTYIFEVVMDADGKGPGFRKLGDKVAAVFPMKVLEVLVLKDKADAPNGDPTALIGKMHRESLFFTNDDSLEYLTAFFVDMGVGKKGSVKSLFAQSVGKRFQGNIQTRKDKNDDTKIYHSLDRNQGKIISEVKRAA